VWHAIIARPNLLRVELRRAVWFFSAYELATFNSELSTLMFGFLVICFAQNNAFFWENGAFPGSGTTTNRFLGRF
jgi:hypothetical protein